MADMSRGTGRRVALGWAAAIGGLLTVGIAPSGAAQRTYPSSVRTEFVRECTKSAVSSSDGALTRSDARRICRSALRCIERSLTLAEFRELDEDVRAGRKNPDAKVITRCTARAAAQAAEAAS